MSGDTWVTSDPHFGHANILNFYRDDGVTKLRPFETVEEMDETLIANWNNVVGERDRVYLLGDVAFHPRVFHRVIPRLKGRICLVQGNHEPPKAHRFLGLFDDVRGYVVKKGYIMSHIPIHPGSMGRWKINIHGHLHANVVLADNEDFAPGNEGEIRLGDPGVYRDPRYVSACVEHHNFTPKNLSELLKENGGPW